MGAKLLRYSSCLFVGILLCSCNLFDPVAQADVAPSVTRVVPAGFRQEDYALPIDEEPNLKKSLLYTEIGAQYFLRGDYRDAESKFREALLYDRYNNRAHFALGIMYYHAGRILDSLSELRDVVPVERKTYPYDIDYFEAAQRILSMFPIQAKVTSVTVSARMRKSKNTVIINKGRTDGIVKGMSFEVFRYGSGVRDAETGQIERIKQRFGIAVAEEVHENSTYCTVDIRSEDQEAYEVQIDDLVETTYLQEIRPDIIQELKAFQ